jgi:hypothetical protein
LAVGFHPLSFSLYPFKLTVLVTGKGAVFGFVIVAINTAARSNR